MRNDMREAPFQSACPPFCMSSRPSPFASRPSSSANQAAFSGMIASVLGGFSRSIASPSVNNTSPHSNPKTAEFRRVAKPKNKPERREASGDDLHRGCRALQGFGPMGNPRAGVARGASLITRSAPAGLLFLSLFTTIGPIRRRSGTKTARTRDDSHFTQDERVCSGNNLHPRMCL